MQALPDPDVQRALDSLEGALPSGAVGMVLGSGLGGLAALLEDRSSVRYGDIPGFPRCRVPGHRGILHAGRVGELPVVAFEGRVHLYEGVGSGEVTFPVRLLHALGARAVLLTSAAGAVNPGYLAGDVALVRDHLNLTGEDPIRSIELERRDPLFPDLRQVYHPLLLERLSGLAFALQIRYQRGVLAALRGPCFETPAEVRALEALGADLVCMSLVPEAITACYMGLPVAGLAIVTNVAGDGARLDHRQVVKRAEEAVEHLKAFVGAALEELDWTT